MMISRHAGVRVETSRASGAPDARCVGLLVAAASGDWAFADLYLERAEAKLAPLLSRERWAAVHDRERLRSQHQEELRRAARHGDWELVRQIAAADLAPDRETETLPEVLTLAGEVYGRRQARTTPLSRAIAADPALTDAHESPRLALQRLCAGFNELTQLDPEWGGLYRRRARHLSSLDLGESRPAPVAAVGELRDQILQAIDHEDLQSVRRLANAAIESRRRHESLSAAPGPARMEIPCTPEVGEPLPDAAIERARAMGLDPCSLPEDRSARAYLYGLSQRSATPRQVLWTKLDLLRGRSFVTSGGGRYLPGFESEWILAEPHPEDFADRGPLLEALGLPRRRGLSRTTIDDALLRHGPHVVRSLELDPFEYRLACIPFDAYLRLAAKQEWGSARQWTHFDGYQIARSGSLLALAGGDVRYGGPEDLCSLSLGYDAPSLNLRLSVVRRARLLAR
jgi:hypothetical protein